MTPLSKKRKMLPGRKEVGFEGHSVDGSDVLIHKKIPGFDAFEVRNSFSGSVVYSLLTLSFLRHIQ